MTKPGSDLLRSIPLIERSGLSVLAQGRGVATCLMPWVGNGNHVGTMYAGSLFAVAEFAGGVLAVNTFDSTRTCRSSRRSTSGS